MRFRWPVAQTFAALASTEVIGRLIRFAYFVAIARFLTPGEVGVYAYGIAFYLTLLGLAVFGQNVFLSTRIGRRPRSLAVIAPHSLTVAAGMIALTAAGGLVFLWAGGAGPGEAWALGFFVLALIARGFTAWVRFCFVALERARWIPRYELLFRGGEALAGTLALLMGGGLVTVCFLHALAWALEAVASFRLLRARTDIPLRLGWDRRLLVRIIRISTVYALGLWLIQAFGQIGVIGLKLAQPDTATVAQFAIAMQLLTTLMIFPAALGQAILPGLSRARRLGDTADIRLIATAIKASLIGGAMIAVVAGVFGPWLVTTVFGARYGSAGETFAVLAWALGPYAAAVIAPQALNALGARHLAAWSAALMVATFVTVMALTMPYGDLQAAVVASIAASSAGAAVAALYLTEQIGLAGPGWWLRPAALLAATGAVFAASTTAAPGWAMLLLVPLLAVLAWWLNVFTREEITAILAKLGLAR